MLHELFLIIIQEYRQKRGMPPTIGWESLAESDHAPNADRRPLSGGSVNDQAATLGEKQTLPSEEKETRAGGGAAEQAMEMLDAFASVGAERFDLTFTDIAGDKVAFRSSQPLGQLRAAMPRILAHAEKRQRNVIIRPRGPVIQLDDLDDAAVEKLRPASFLVLRTSPGNYQAWVAVADADEDFARRLRKGAGADLTASGATRVSGSLNFKDKYCARLPARRNSPKQLRQGSDAGRTGGPRRCGARRKGNACRDPRPSHGPPRMAELPALPGGCP